MKKPSKKSIIIGSVIAVIAAALMSAMIAAGMSINAVFLSMAFFNLLMLPLTLKLARTDAVKKS